MTVKPDPVGPDSTVALVSPSSAIATAVPHRLERAKAALERLGLTVVEYESTRDTTPRGPERTRRKAEDLMRAFEDPDVDLILPTIGGHRANELLELLDYDRIAENPTVVTGFSDVVTLTLPIYQQTGMVVFHGPTAIPQFGEYPEPFEYTVEQFVAAVSGELSGPIEPSEAWTNEYLEWMEQADLERPRERYDNAGYEWLREGTATGEFVAGHITSLMHIRGTEYWPDLDGKILCIEENPLEVGPRRIESLVYDLDLSGDLENLAGLVVGRTGQADSEAAEWTREAVSETVADYDYPVLFGVDISHSDPHLTIPMGVEVELDSEAGTFSVLESGTR